MGCDSAIFVATSILPVVFVAAGLRHADICCFDSERLIASFFFWQASSPGLEALLLYVPTSRTYTPICQSHMLCHTYIFVKLRAWSRSTLVLPLMCLQAGGIPLFLSIPHIYIRKIYFCQASRPKNNTSTRDSTLRLFGAES